MAAVLVVGLWLCSAVALFGAGASAKVEFQFSAPLLTEGNPYARALWCLVERPDGSTLRAPAFFVEEGPGGDRFAVRIYGGLAGRYRLLRIEEEVDGGVRRLRLPREGVEMESARAQPREFIRIDSKTPGRFAFVGGGAFIPIGGNLPWPPPEAEEPAGHYRERFARFAAAGLNWTRIWMAHWAGLNLDWIPEEKSGRQPVPGTIDPVVAASWDEILEAAERAGVYVQVVMQHHGQYSTRVNSNWLENPWNTANGGFLKEPGEFFTSPRALALTKLKIRYIIARWGWCPAVLAWELFNEVHWTDPINLEHDESSVAAWHAAIAEFIRSVDVHGHLVTTSTDSLRSPIFDRMDYLQPHLYAPEMITAVRVMDQVSAAAGRPVFYGEIGDDQMGQSEAQKKAAVGLVAPVWSGIMGMAELPPQLWYIDRLIEADRFGELAAVARFLRETELEIHRGLHPFSPSMHTDSEVPFVVRPAFKWERRGDQALTVPFDGSHPLDLANFPAVFVGDQEGRAIGFPSTMTLRLHPRKAGNLELGLGGAGARGATAEIYFDGALVAKRNWPAVGDRSAGNGNPPVPVSISLPSGRHVLAIRNPGDPPDWFEVTGLTAKGFALPALAAVGRRSDDFIALWIWHRDGVFAVEPGESVSGTVMLEKVPAGAWRVQWWDSVAGVPEEEIVVRHPGGMWRLVVPGTSRHRAVVLKRQR